MKPWQVFALCSSLMLLAFGLYVLAPIVRAHLDPKPTAPVVIQRPAPAQSEPAKAQAPNLQTAKPAPKPPAKVDAEQTKASWTPWRGDERPQYISAAPSPAPPVAVPPAAPETPVDYEQLWNSRNGVRVVTFPILAGQELSVTNPQFNFIKVESDYPVSVSIGDCQSTKTTLFSCNGVSLNSPIIVQDLRSDLPADVSPRNGVKLTGILHE